ncbi:uncharacterized protein [Physcomitrium patens]|uniref:NIF system FeS cluster assembly NifU C-terminal domain-containing protein n=1 Tax=Physcomitrium patens TaxID=3218 RepID=A0A2K1JUW0_PHYPA|nr:uncharacterized protein LOC112288656 [Physcomitrium patens]PNR45311.1 hypothetical protein PHYPA_015082 [Physcomitrium patens]|eukprot:XP_024388853.1 uncharacterized protein LOC112288656 [Physcomitrella patens]
MSSVLGVSASCVAGHVAQSRSWVPSVNARISTHRRVFVGGAGVTRSHGWRTLERGVARRSGGTGWGGSNAQTEPLDLTEENVQQVLLDARSELLQLFDLKVGITGVVQLAEIDGPFVTLRLSGRFWHTRSMVLARVANYLQKRIPEIVEVQIEDESQLDDSAANF